MSGWIDEKYVMMLRPHLEGFTLKRQNPLLVNCRCPLCGDSQKSKSKKRGYFYTRSGSVFYSCKNCGEGTTLKSMLWRLDKELYNEYQVENYVGFVDHLDERPVEVVPVVEKSGDLDGLVNMSDMYEDHPSHPAVKYLLGRKVPSSQFRRLYWTDAYYAFINAKLPEKFSDKALALDKGRIVFPFTDRFGRTYGYCGRTIDPKDTLRYVSIKLDETATKVFGLDHVNFNQNIFVFEGQIDSLFVPNSIAVAGGDVHAVNLPKDRTILCWDNEPRNKDVVRMIGRAIDGHYQIFLWPPEWRAMKKKNGEACKDINDLVLAGVPVDSLVPIIRECASSGMLAMLKFDAWKMT